ncbi:hypothetical protein ACLOJK_027112 [Asimina triloba]
MRAGRTHGGGELLRMGRVAGRDVGCRRLERLLSSCGSCWEDGSAVRWRTVGRKGQDGWVLGSCLIWQAAEWGKWRTEANDCWLVDAGSCGRVGAAMGVEDGCWIGWTVMGSAAMAAEQKWGRWVFNLFAMCALMLEGDRGIGFSTSSSSLWADWIGHLHISPELAAGSNGCRPW